MTAQEIVEAVIDILAIVINWPVIILILVLLFRRQIEQLFGILGERLRRISVGGATAEFEDPELKGLIRAMASSVRVDAHEDVMEEEALAPGDEGDEVSQAANDESLEQELQRLKGTLGR